MGAWEIELWNSEGVTFITDEKERGNYLRPSILLFETLLILVVFNSSSYFGTTTYARSIDSI
ncbi:MAG: hypothetical protein ACE5FT_07145, partial [Candidatus Nanoarchaeia archaeon]